MYDQILKLRLKEHNLQKQYEDKVKAFFQGKKPKQNRSQLQNEYIQICSNLYGHREQLYSLESSIQNDKNKINYINSLSELQLKNEDIESLIETQDVNLLVEKFKATELNEFMFNVFQKNGNNLIKVLIQFVNKRNVYRKNNNEHLLNELILLKSLIVKHISIMKKLIEPLTHQ